MRIQNYSEYLRFLGQRWLAIRPLPPVGIWRLQPPPKDVQISTYANDITITASHTCHHLSPTIYSTIFLQSTTLFTLDPAKYDTTLSFNLNNQTPPTTKHPKTLLIIFNPKVTFLQYLNLTVIKAKQTLDILKVFTSNKYAK